ncbi:hypothetical protein D9M71_710300 [compost metagenome]
MAYKYDRKNRNIRLNDFEWECFKDLMGADWLREQIHETAKKHNRKDPQPTKE